MPDDRGGRPASRSDVTVACKLRWALGEGPEAAGAVFPARWVRAGAQDLHSSLVSRGPWPCWSGAALGPSDQQVFSADHTGKSGAERQLLDSEEGQGNVGRRRLGSPVLSLGGVRPTCLWDPLQTQPAFPSKVPGSQGRVRRLAQH